MKKHLTILLAILLLACNYKQELSGQQKLYLTAKVWGFLKYYHPAINEGQINWDNELIAILPKLPAANDKEAFSKLLLDWIESLGEVDPARDINYDSSHSFNNNFNLGWLEDDGFTKDLTRRLRYIEQNRSQKLRYVTKGYDVGQIEMANEVIYTASH